MAKREPRIPHLSSNMASRPDFWHPGKRMKTAKCGNFLTLTLLPELRQQTEIFPTNPGELPCRQLKSAPEHSCGLADFSFR